jgi:hypothetical protein
MTNEQTEINTNYDAAQSKSRIEDGAWLVIGSAISTAFGVVFFMWQRGRQAKDHFLITLSQLGAELERTEDVLQFYDATLSRTEEAVSKLSPFIRKTRRTDLSIIWNLYRQTRAALCQASDDSLTHRVFWDYFSQRGYKEPKTKRDIVKLFHKKFAEIAT